MLEPGCGSGNFMGLAPADMHFIGIEMDPVRPHRQALYPDQDIRIEDFRDIAAVGQNRIDAVIGNGPFSDEKRTYDGTRLSLHDFFLAKSVDALKPGGVLALVTSLHAR